MFSKIFSRMARRVVKFAIKTILAVFVVAFIVLLCIGILDPGAPLPLTGGGPQSEKFFKFANSITTVIQDMWFGIVGIFQIIAIILLATGYGIAKLIIAYGFAFEIFAVVGFFVWLIFATMDECARARADEPELGYPWISVCLTAAILIAVVSICFLPWWFGPHPNIGYIAGTEPMPEWLVHQTAQEMGITDSQRRAALGIPEKQ